MIAGQMNELGFWGDRKDGQLRSPRVTTLLQWHERSFPGSDPVVGWASPLQSIRFDGNLAL